MQQRAVFLRRAVAHPASTTAFVQCRLFSSILVLLPRQPHTPPHTRPTSHTLLRAVSSSSSSFPSFSPSLATASFSTVTVAPATRTRVPSNEKDVDVDASSSLIYVGPLTQTFRRLKIFSLSSLVLASSLSPLIFIVESCLPTTARAALAATAVGTSGVSTALVAWCGRPYVTAMRSLSAPPPSPSATPNTSATPSTSETQATTTTTHSHNENVPAGIELTTLTLALSPLTTRVYDPAFLCDTTRAFARWELAHSVQLPPEDAAGSFGGGAGGARPGAEETVAETLDGSGNVLGRWIVTWGENGEGSCRAEGRIVT